MQGRTTRCAQGLPPPWLAPRRNRTLMPLMSPHAWILRHRLRRAPGARDPGGVAQCDRGPLARPLALLSIDMFVWNFAALAYSVVRRAPSGAGWRPPPRRWPPPLVLHFILTFVGRRRALRGAMYAAVCRRRRAIGRAARRSPSSASRGRRPSRAWGLGRGAPRADCCRCPPGERGALSSRHLGRCAGTGGAGAHAAAAGGALRGLAARDARARHGLRGEARCAGRTWARCSAPA